MGKKRICENLSNVSAGLLDLLFPPQCHICGKNLMFSLNQFVCSSCLQQIEFVQSPVCPRCGKQHDRSTGLGDHYCSECLNKPPPIDSARSAVCYDQPVVELLHRLKYQGDTSVSGAIKEILLKGRTAEPGHSFDMIAPVPLYISRLKSRGLNQSLILAEILPGSKNKIVSNLLVRARNTSPQTGLSGSERRKNVKGAFGVNRFENVKNKSILVIDDVFTTGTTVAECARTLKKKGAKAVHVWTFARV